MLLATLLMQGSLLAHPLYLEPEKPELRGLQHILVLHDDLEKQGFSHGRDHDQALELVKSLEKRIDDGEDFGDLAAAYSNARTRSSFGSLGCYPQGMLREPYDEFLFGAELGECSPIFDLPSGLHLLKRVESHVAILQIQLDGKSDETRALALQLCTQLRNGADFGELAMEHSSDRQSAERGGQFRVFERGSSDTLLKLAAFRATPGVIGEPVETPLGLHIIKRVDPADFAPELWDNNFLRARGLLVAHLLATGVDPNLNRTQTEAKELAEEAIRRFKEGEPFAEIAARFNDDPGGKARAGDLGWIHRQNPDLPQFFGPLFLAEPGTITEPLLTPVGVVVLLREQ